MFSNKGNYISVIYFQNKVFYIFINLLSLSKFSWQSRPHLSYIRMAASLSFESYVLSLRIHSFYFLLMLLQQFQTSFTKCQMVTWAISFCIYYWAKLQADKNKQSSYTEVGSSDMKVFKTALQKSIVKFIPASILSVLSYQWFFHTPFTHRSCS